MVENNPEEPAAFMITGSPTAALMPGTKLLVGVEGDALDTRAYLGSRHLGIHVHLSGESAQLTRFAWDAGYAHHLYTQGIPQSALCGCRIDAKEESA